MIKLCSLILSQACLASLICSLAYLLACLLDNLINSFIWIVRSLKSLLKLFFKTECFLVFVPIFCIGTIFLFRVVRQMISSVLIYLTCYRLPVITWHLIPACYYLTPAPWYDITYHLPPGMTAWPVIITFTGILSWFPVLYTVTCYPILYIQWPESILLMYSCNFLNLSCSCHSRKLIII